MSDPSTIKPEWGWGVTWDSESIGMSAADWVGMAAVRPSRETAQCFADSLRKNQTVRNVSDPIPLYAGPDVEALIDIVDNEPLCYTTETELQKLGDFADRCVTKMKKALKERP